MLTALAMLAFAGNSILCRLALISTSIDAASFTLIRLLNCLFQRASTSAIVQLGVPVITVALGTILLNEAIDLRTVMSSAAILAGILIFSLNDPSTRKAS